MLTHLATRSHLTYALQNNLPTGAFAERYCTEQMRAKGGRVTVMIRPDDILAFAVEGEPTGEACKAAMDKYAAVFKAQ